MHSLHQATIVFLFLKDLKRKKKKKEGEEEKKKTEKKDVTRQWSIWLNRDQVAGGRLANTRPHCYWNANGFLWQLLHARWGRPAARPPSRALLSQCSSPGAQSGQFPPIGLSAMGHVPHKGCHPLGWAAPLQVIPTGAEPPASFRGSVPAFVWGSLVG